MEHTEYQWQIQEEFTKYQRQTQAENIGHQSQLREDKEYLPCPIIDNWTMFCLPTWHRVRPTFRCTNPITVLCCLIFCEILMLQVGQIFNPVTVPLNINSLATQTQHRARTVSLEVCTRCHDMVEILVDVLSFSQYSYYTLCGPFQSIG